MDVRKQELLERLTQVSDRLAAQTRQGAMQDWLGVDLTLAQLRAVGFLGQGPQRMGDIAAYLGGSVSSSTSLIERLEGKGLVARTHHTDDRRVVLCGLTPEGQEVLDRLWRMRRHQLDSVADLLSLDDLAKVVEAMELLATAFAQPAPAGLCLTAERESPELIGQP